MTGVSGGSCTQPSARETGAGRVGATWSSISPFHTWSPFWGKVSLGRENGPG